MKQQPSPGLLDLLDAHELDEGSVAAAERFGSEGRRKLLKAAQGKLKGVTEDQRGRAVYLLGLLGHADVAEDLTHLIDKHETASLCINTLYALSMIKGPGAADQLLSFVKEQDHTWVEHAHALDILAELGDPRHADQIPADALASTAPELEEVVADTLAKLRQR